MIELHKYLGVGNLYYSRNEINIVVRSLDDITNIIIPHFDNHPLRGHKLTSYIVFKEVVLMINNGKHLTPRESADSYKSLNYVTSLIILHLKAGGFLVL